jgi:RND family efflux transporter MFP subunit
MKIIPQLLMIAAIGAMAVPLAARFLPVSHPVLDSLGLLQPMSALGLVPAAQAAETQGGQGGPARAGGTPVVAAPVKQQVLSDVVTAIGSARGIQSVALAPGVSGRLLTLHVAPGDMVQQGDLVAELDAEAAQLAVQRAELVLADARTTLERIDRLAGSGAATNLQRQDAELALRTAELALQSAERDLADHQLTAPIGGIVGLIEVQVGDLISPNSEVTRIEDRSSLILDFRVPERVTALIRTGDEVSVSAVATPNEMIEGKITAIDNRVDEASRTLRVQASIDNTQDALRSGMAFRVALQFTGAEYPAVDPLAIQWGSEGAFIWVVRAGKAMQLPIRILQRNADAVLVDTALEPDDLVVTEGVQALRPGADVAVSDRGEGS